ncbi:hypothetical protein EDM76_07035, partial [bacterium]
MASVRITIVFSARQGVPEASLGKAVEVVGARLEALFPGAEAMNARWAQLEITSPPPSSFYSATVPAEEVKRVLASLHEQMDELG